MLNQDEILKAIRIIIMYNTNNDCEFCIHSVIDDKRYHGTMLKCKAEIDFKWDKKYMYYRAVEIPCTERIDFEEGE